MEASGNVQRRREDLGGGRDLEPGGCVQVDVTARRQRPGVNSVPCQSSTIAVKLEKLVSR